MFEIGGGYTFTNGDTTRSLQDGGAGSFGITWFPSSNLPLGIRFEGSYSRFNATLDSRRLASIATGTNVAYGHTNLYGGNIDARLDLAHRSPRFGMYLFGGIGRYRTQTQFSAGGGGPGLDLLVLLLSGLLPGRVHRVEVDLRLDEVLERRVRDGMGAD